MGIQSHPDKQLAEQLHRERPAVYKDDNHKPEMAIALTAFEAMCGFRSVEEIANNLKEYPELAACINEELSVCIEATTSADEVAVKEVLRAFLDSFMNSEDEVVQRELQNLVSRLGDNDNVNDVVILRLAEQYPGDPGAMAPLFLNVL